MPPGAVQLKGECSSCEALLSGIEAGFMKGDRWTIKNSYGF